MGFRVTVDDSDRGSGPELGPLVPPPGAFYERLRAAMDEPPHAPVKRTAQAVQRGSLPAAYLLLPLALVAVLAIDALLRERGLWRADASALAHARPALAGAFAFAGATALALAATALALARGRDGLGVRVALLRLCALAIAPLSLVLMLALAGERERAHEPLHAWGAPCFFVAGSVAALSLLILLRARAHSVTAALGWRSAAFASAATAWAGLALLLHCPAGELGHLLVGHWLPICLFPLLGRLLAPRYLAL
jgi:hypothetical protein